MKSFHKFTFFVVFALIVSFLIGGGYLTKHKSIADKKVVGLAVYEDGSSTPFAPKIGGNFVPSVTPPASRIVGLDGYMDYVTNGNSLNQLIVKGDTVAVATNYCDSLEATNANGGSTLRIRYNVSYDKGTTWSSTTGLDMTSDQKSRYPDAYVMTIGGVRTLNTSGRYWNPPANSTTRKAGTSHDVLLGIGNPTTTLMTTTGTDLFSTWKPDNKIGCLLQRPSSTTQVNDTIWYVEFNPETHTFGTPYILDTRTLANTVMSYTIKAAATGNHMTAGWIYINEPGNGGDNWRSFRVRQSTDNGATWSAVTKWGFVAATPNILGGDSCQMYWHDDIEYKPGTQTPYLVFSTLPYVWNGSATVFSYESWKGWKIMIQSPSLNGNIPVTIADYHNIPILGDTVMYNDITDYQVNSALLSHPSLGFSEDGNIMYVAYSVIQKELVPPPAVPFNYFDVYYSISTNGGANWGTPVNVTQTDSADEMYPIVASQNNPNNPANGPYITYNWNAIPGCHAFTDNQIVSIVYYCLYKPPVGIKSISGEVPNRYELMQNYPNPFNPLTKIRFALPNSSNVTLKVYDITGREVATLINNELIGAGTSEVEFSALNISSGVYFYNIKAGDFNETKKMIVTK